MAAMVLILLVLALHLPQALRADVFPYALQWKRLVPGIVGGALVQRDSLVFAGTTDGRVLAIGRDDGLGGVLVNQEALVDEAGGHLLARGGHPAAGRALHHGVDG